MKELIKAFEGHKVRTLIIKREPWWVLADVCKVLGISNTSDAAGRLEPDEKGVGITDTLGGAQEATIINESGLYSLIFTSRKEEAKRFRKWVTSEVLPMIRKTGRYEIPADDQTKSKKARGFLTAQWADHGASTPRDFQNLPAAHTRAVGWGGPPRRRTWTGPRL